MFTSTVCVWCRPPLGRWWPSIRSSANQTTSSLSPGATRWVWRGFRWRSVPESCDANSGGQGWETLTHGSGVWELSSTQMCTLVSFAWSNSATSHGSAVCLWTKSGPSFSFRFVLFFCFPPWWREALSWNLCWGTFTVSHFYPSIFALFLFLPFIVNCSHFFSLVGRRERLLPCRPLVGADLSVRVAHFPQSAVHQRGVVSRAQQITVITQMTP